jgi:hypothetical protein
MTPTIVQRLIKSQNMKLDNARKMPETAQTMYLQGKVKLCRANFAASKANMGKGWVSV